MHNIYLKRNQHHSLSTLSMSFVKTICLCVLFRVQVGNSTLTFNLSPGMSDSNSIYNVYSAVINNN